MKNQGHYDRQASRYVTRTEQAEISALWASFFQVEVEPSFEPEATPRRCMRHFGAYNALCLAAPGCASLAECARVARRAGAVLLARQHVLEMRQ